MRYLVLLVPFNTKIEKTYGVNWKRVTCDRSDKNNKNNSNNNNGEFFIVLNNIHRK